MEICLQNSGPGYWKADLMIAFGCEGENILEVNSELDTVCPWLAVSPALRDFHGKSGEIALCHGHPELKVPRVLLVGLGERSRVNLRKLRAGMGEAMNRARAMGMATILLPEPNIAGFSGGRERLLQECVFAGLISLYRYTELKTITADISKNPECLAIGFDVDAIPEGSREAITHGENDAAAVALARNLDNSPGNLLYPEILALKASSLAQENGFKCTILNENELDEAGMGCMLAVGSGSAHAPRLVVLEYAAEGHAQDKPLIFIGKGITFDSGGLCIKPAANMSQMKCDMSGAAAVLAAVSALAREKAPVHLVGILACAENMPDGRAYRPGDVLRSASGLTVEVINTDAEGRLVLCDALAYAQKNWTPAAMVDIATLTGACAVALGKSLAGLFCDDAQLAEKIAAFGSVCGENYWHMPLWEPYMDELKSNVADICHTAGREGGAITAALFLSRFVRKGELWAHLDIAGVDWVEKGNALCPEGASGFGARTLIELARGGLA